MSLKIKTELKNESGFAATDAYVRIAVVDNIEGNIIEGVAQYFITKEAFENKASSFNPMGIETGFHFPYNRATMSKDILGLAHDLYISYLAEQGITAEKEL